MSSLGAADRAEVEPPTWLGDGRARSPLQAEPFDKQPCADTLQGTHSVLDRFAQRSPISPVRGEEPPVVRGRGTGRHHRRQRRIEQPHAVVDVFVDVEDVHHERVLISWPRPPTGASCDPVITKGQPQPFRTAATASQVIDDLVIEDVRKAVEETNLVAPQDRPQDQVIGS